MSPSDRRQLPKEVAKDGFTLHAEKNCHTQCCYCKKAKELLSWPNNVPLLKSQALHTKAHLDILCDHYGLPGYDDAYKGQSLHFELKLCHDLRLHYLVYFHA